MPKLESLTVLEAGSKHFQTLTKEEQERRRGLLSDILGTVIDKGKSLDYGPKETGVILSMALELHLTGQLDRDIKHSKKKRKPKKIT